MDYEQKKTLLASYVTLRTDAENMEERLTRLESEAVMPPQRVGDGSKHTGGSGDRLERATIRLMERKEIDGPQIEAARRKMRAIENAVAALRDPLERSVLRLRYLYSDNSRLVKWAVVALSVYGDDDEKDIQAVKRLTGGRWKISTWKGLTPEYEKAPGSRRGEPL